jgi:hypothetical protein
VIYSRILSSIIITVNKCMLESVIGWLLKAVFSLAGRLIFMLMSRVGNYIFFTIQRIVKYLTSSKNPLLAGNNHIRRETRLNVLIQEMDDALEELLGDKCQKIHELTQAGAPARVIAMKHFHYWFALVGVFFVHSINILIHAKS